MTERERERERVTERERERDRERERVTESSGFFAVSIRPASTLVAHCTPNRFTFQGKAGFIFLSRSAWGGHSPHDAPKFKEVFP